MVNSDIPDVVRVTVRYDKKLQEITGQQEDIIFMNKESIFLFFLHCIFTDYPEIQERYPPGVLGFTLNGEAPGSNSKLFDGDEIWFEVVD